MGTGVRGIAAPAAWGTVRPRHPSEPGGPPPKLVLDLKVMKIYQLVKLVNLTIISLVTPNTSVTPWHASTCTESLLCEIGRYTPIVLNSDNPFYGLLP